MARTSLQNARSLPDPLFTYNWDIFIPNLPGGGDTRALTWKATSASIPAVLLESVPVNLGPVELRYAGRENYSHSWPVTLHETRDVGSRAAILAWQKIARDNINNTGNYKEVYAPSMELVLYDDIPAEVRRIVLYGVWPETVDEPQLDRASGAVSLAVTFSYDYFEDA